jgi:CheY-like chemotaxis protein
VVFVSDGRQAVDAVLREFYALVFMDCQMPIMDGLAATRAIREGKRTRGGHIPITAMTANAFCEDRDACIAASMDHYLAKPVKSADLRTTLERWSRQRLS